MMKLSLRNSSSITKPLSGRHTDMITKSLKVLIALAFLLTSQICSAQINQYRAYFKDYRFSIFKPVDCLPMEKKVPEAVDVCYLPPPNEPQSKTIVYYTNIYSRNPGETEQQFIERYKANMNPGFIVEGDFTIRHLNSYHFEYRSMRYEYKDVSTRSFFFFRRADVVLLEYRYNRYREKELDRIIREAVDNFYWDGMLVDMPPLNLRVNLPFDVDALWDDEQKRTVFAVALDELNKETEAGIFLQKLPDMPRIDSAQVRQNLEKELSQFPHIKLLRKELGIEFNNDYLADYYLLEYVEGDSKFQTHVYDAYFGAQLYRLTVTTLKGTYEKIEKSINNIKMSLELM